MCWIPFKSCLCGKRTGRRSREILNGQTITTSSHNNDDQVQFMEMFQDIRSLGKSEMWKNEFYPRDNPKSSENRSGDQRKGKRCPLALENQNDLKASHAAKHGMQQASPPIHVPVLRLKLLEQRTHNFSDKYKIGEGSYGIVYYADLNTGRPMVIKKLHISSEHASKKEFLEQVSFASKLKHENFVELLGYCVEKNNRLLAYEHALMGSLHDVLHGKKAEKDSRPGLLLNWMQRVKIAVEAARGLDYLHKHQPPIVHGNIRSSNILLFANYKAKIADYDLSNKAPDMGTCLHSISPLGYFGYQAPEYAMALQLTQKSDVYSYGVVLLELLTGRKPNDYTFPDGQRSLVTWATLKLSEDRVIDCVDPKLKDNYPIEGAAKLAEVAEACLKFESTDRPSMSDIIRAFVWILPPAADPLLCENVYAI